MKRPLNIAHRGGAALRPENTLVAFSNAIALGADGAELDVQLSADGAVMVHHDLRLNPALTRHAGGWLKGQTPAIKNLTYAALQAYEVGRPDPASAYAASHPKLRPAEKEHIPSLDAVLGMARTVRPPFLLFVELKSSQEADPADPVALADEALSVMEDYLPYTVFVGFDWRGLTHLKQQAPQARCWFTTDRMEGDIHPALDGIAAAKADGWFAEWRNVSAENVAFARQLGLAVGAWTVNEVVEMKRLAALGLDAICTDRPDLLAGVLDKF